jgi:predicted metal-dependent peptidase
MESLKGKLEEVQLTGDQSKRWDETRSALIWHCPAFAHILYTMLNKDGRTHIALFTEYPEIPIAATDGYNLILRPSTFFKLPLKQRVFVVAHEILHCILNHCAVSYQLRNRGKIPFPDGKVLPYDHKTANIAQDLVINDVLIDSKVGEFIPGGLHDTAVATFKDSWLEAYRKIYKKPPPGGQGFDLHMDPGTTQGKDPQTATSERSAAEWDTAVAAATNAARLQGKLPAGLDRLLGEVLDPQVDWREHIRALFARKVGSGTYDLRRVDRRLIVRDIIAAGRAGFGAGTVVCAVDTSGSIGEGELNMFFAEMAGILEDVRPKHLYIMWCDAQVHRVDECDEPSDLNVVRAKKAPGGGGTSFIPVFDKMADLGVEPDALVYLTDGYGLFPQAAPSYPVIWGSITPKGAVKYPFGDVVEVPKQA